MGRILNICAVICCSALSLPITGCFDGARFGARAGYPDQEKPRGVVEGHLTDAVTGAKLAEVAVSFEPLFDPRELRTELHPVRSGALFSTDENGFFYAKIPVGRYQLSFAKDEYRGAELAVEVSDHGRVARHVRLEPSGPVLVFAGEPVTGASPGSTVHLKAGLTIRDGSKLQTLGWQLQGQQGRVTPRFVAGPQGELAVTLPELPAYKKALLERLGRQGRLLDRWMVVSLGPLDLKEAGTVVLVASSDTTSGSYSDTATIRADLSSLAVVNPGLHNVPLGKAVLLQGKDQQRYAWSLSGPPGSSARLNDQDTQNPSFTPDLAGAYTVAEGKAARLVIYAGTWNGAVVARETDRRPGWIGKEGCLCHYDDKVSRKFAAWRSSGHAEIFTHNVNNSYRYQEACFSCHTVVGTGRGVPAADFAFAQSYRYFLADPAIWDLTVAPPLVKPRSGNLDYLLESHPGVVRLANVQCENCHGPNNSDAHRNWGKPGTPRRISRAAGVCAACHDGSSDPSFEQWRETGHANYNLALTVATVERGGADAGECGHCHSAQGFLAWYAQRQRGGYIQGKNGAATPEELGALGLSVESVEPITCAVCHDPHGAGNSFRSAVDKVPTRISNDTALSPREFGTRTGGRGALCIACHSTTSGPHNDRALPVFDPDRAPHVAQADVLMGENAFFVETGRYDSHARIEDSCVWCHAKPVPKDPTAFGYQRGGVNHSFQASREICSSCHQEFQGEELLAATGRDLDKLKSVLEAALLDAIRGSGSVLLKAARDGGDASLAAAELRTVELIELKGKMAIGVTTQGGEFIAAPFLQVSLGEVALATTASGRILAKACWNYLLLKSDASSGAHNPRFVSEVLGRTMEQVAALRPAPPK